MNKIVQQTPHLVLIARKQPIPESDPVSSLQVLPACLFDGNDIPKDGPYVSFRQPSRNNPNLPYQGEVDPSAPTELILTLCWIDKLLTEDSEVARAALEDNDFLAELTELRRSLERRAYNESEAALDGILEKFALVQSIAFENTEANRD